MNQPNTQKSRTVRECADLLEISVRRLLGVLKNTAEKSEKNSRKNLRRPWILISSVMSKTAKQPTKKQFKSFYLGTRKKDGAHIRMEGARWSCGWYWGFGYLGNQNEHYHLDGYQSEDHFLKLEDGSYKGLTEKRNICMHDALLKDYDLSEKIKADLWKFCEIVLSIYKLKEASEMFHIGGAHMTSNPCEHLLGRQDLSDEINIVMIPALLEELEKRFA